MAIGDTQYDDVVLLLHGEGSNGSTTFTDSSKYAHTLTAAGNAQISTAQSKWGSSSMLFDGTGDYVSAEDNVLSIAPGDFTIECWFRTSSLAADQGIWFLGDIGSALNRVQLWLSTAGALQFYISGLSGTSNVTSSVTISADTWYYVKCFRNGTALTIQVDSTVTNSTVTGNVITYRKFYVGVALFSATSIYLNGYIDDIRVTEYARTGTDVPTAAFPEYAAQLTGNITESLDITDWMISSVRCSNGKENGSTYVTGSSYTLNVHNNEPSLIACSPRVDYAWSAGKTTVLGDFVVAVNPDGTPHLWKCTTAGETHATTEPTWNLSSTTTDNTTTWTYVAPLEDPITLGPKIPS